VAFEKSEGQKRQQTRNSQAFLQTSNQTERLFTMTKSKGLGRGGTRPGAGRPPKPVNWDAVGRAYYTGTANLDDVCAEHGVTYGDLLAYGANNNWLQRRPTKAHPDDLGGLASALALAMWSVELKPDRASRFVAAMTILGERDIDIAEALNISVEQLKREFRKELATAC
jgi:hypothetical protein